MKLYDLKDESGRIFAFEVANFGRHRACRFVGKIPGVVVLRRQRHFQFLSDEEFCEFELEGQRFVIWEPWGDNSRYWVGPKPPQWCPEVEQVRNAFAAYKASELLLRGIFCVLFALALLTYSVVRCLTGSFFRYDVLISLGGVVFFAVYAVLDIRSYFAKSAPGDALNSDPKKRREN
jgi:hypothetical protein